VSGLWLIQAAMPGWVGPTAALSLVVIAASFVAIALALLAAGRATQKATAELREEIHGLREEIGPALQAVNRVAVKVEGISDQVAGEIREVLETSRRTRYDFERGLRRAKARLEDFDALVEVVQEEVEETALDAAAAMRSVRTAGGAIGVIRRLLVRGRR
jgi:methyl-accepting chemotaxis protein